MATTPTVATCASDCSGCSNNDLFANKNGPGAGYGGCVNAGDTAWIMSSTAIVLMMTIPGLAMFYGGMVQPKNYLHTVMQCFTICCLITCMWMIFGYSLSFRPGTAVIGGADRFWLIGMEIYSVHPFAKTIPESVFMMFQMTFAIITPALIVGGLAERMKFSALIVFMAAWHLIVYCFVAHSVWGPDGFLRTAGILDFAGGSVVHLSSGVAALMCAIVLGKRHGHGNARFEPHNVSISLIGASLLWVGWFGFNAGSAVSSGALAGQAMANTQICAGAAGMSWMMTEWFVKGKPTLMSVISGAVSGLVSITPGAGFVDYNGAIIMGFITGILCSQSIRLKHYFGYDDALDAFGVHGMGGAIGSILTGLFATPKLNNFYPACPYDTEPCMGEWTQRVSGAFYDRELTKYYGVPNRYGKQIGLQLYGIMVVAGYSGFATYCILKVIDKVMGLRVDIRDEVEGLDASVHGETVYYGGDDMKPPEVSTHGTEMVTHS